MRQVRWPRAVILPSLIVCAMMVGPVRATEAEGGPVTDAAEIVALNLEGAGAVVALTAGRFVEDQASHAVDVVDESGRWLERLPLGLRVDGETRVLKLVIDGGGRQLAARVEGGLRAGATVVADLVRQGGVLGDACLERGLPAAVVPALVGAITGALTGVLGGPMGIVTGAALGGLSGAWTGFTNGCTQGVLEALQPTGFEGRLPVHRLRQIQPS